MTAFGDRQLRRLRMGLTASVMASVIALPIWGWQGISGAAMMGGVATAMQLFAARAMHRTGVPATVDHLKVYLFGMFLRMLGVAVVGMLVAWRPGLFPLWPSAWGYLATVLPLLYLETRLA